MRENQLILSIDGKAVAVEDGTLLAAALINNNRDLRGPLCGMGTCFECRVTVDGVPHQRACRVVCRDGQRIETS